MLRIATILLFLTSAFCGEVGLGPIPATASLAAPGPIGATTASSGAFTTLTSSNTAAATSVSTGAVQTSGGYAASRPSFFRGVASSSDANAVLVNFFSNQTVDPAAYRTSVAVTNNNGGATAGNTSVTAAFTGSVGNSIAGVTLADVRIFEANADTSNATATNTATYGFYFKNGTNTGTTTTKTGYYCEALTGTTVYSFRSAGAGKMLISDTTEASAVTTAAAVLSGGLAVTKNALLAQGVGVGVTSTATAAGTTTLTSTSKTLQIFTGSTTQTITLPAANVFGSGIGQILIIKNRSSGALTVNRAGSDTIDGGTTTNVATGVSITLISNGSTEWTIN